VKDVWLLDDIDEDFEESLHILKVPLRPSKHPWGLKVQPIINQWAPKQPLNQVSLEDLKHAKKKNKINH